MIRQPTAAEVAAAQAEIFALIGASGAPRVANLDAATTAHDDGALTLVPRPTLWLRFRARRFRVPFLTWRDGLTLFYLDHHRTWCWRELARLADQGRAPPGDPEAVAVVRDLYAATAEILDVCWHLVRPLTWWDRLTWRWRANPFLDASEGEVRALTGFFWRARRMCRAHTRASLRAPRFLRRTSPPSPPILPLASRPGWFQRGSHMAATPAAGGTTNWGSPPSPGSE